MQWISVKDTLPKENEWVLVWNKDDVDIARYDRGEWKDFTSILRHVTHWMPKPEKPRDNN